MERTCTNRSYIVLMQTSKAIHERIKIEMTKNKLNITEFSVLESLYLKGKQTIQQIGNTILISSGSMTYVIDKLEQKGLLNRNNCPNDRRAIHVTLTTDGMDLMNKILPKHQKFIDSMFGSLNSEEEETVVKLLKKVSERVEA